MNAILEEPYDPGLQPERTLLAWRRTCLSLGAAVTVAVRFAVESLGSPAAALGAAGLGAVGIGAALAAYLVAARRYRHTRDWLGATDRLPVDGAALGLMTVTMLLIGLAAGVYVMGAAWR